MQKTEPDGLVRFGVFELDARSGELRSKGSRVKLQDQPLQVLLAVLEKPGQVVTREELRARLWPADTFVDFDHGLNAAVKRLRDALGDTAENPRYIETLPRAWVPFHRGGSPRRTSTGKKSYVAKTVGLAARGYRSTPGCGSSLRRRCGRPTQQAFVPFCYSTADPFPRRAPTGQPLWGSATGVLCRCYDR